MMKRALPRNGATTPPMMAVRIPEIGGAPLALAIPRHRGRAMRKTRKPESISDLSEGVLRVSIM
jgi:hypothetical protein